MAEKTSLILTAEDRTRAAFASLRNSMKSVQGESLALNRSFAGLVPALTIGGLVAFAKTGIDAADALNDMSQRLGVSVKDLASFKLVAEQSGTSLDGVGAGIARLSKSIGEAEGGNKQMAKSLAELKITARDPKEAFFQLADAVQRIQDPTKRAALLSDVLGKSYGELVPLLAQGGTELRKSAAESESFAETMARLAPDADRFNDQLALLKQNAAAAAAEGLIPLVEAMNRTAERFGVLGRLRDAGASIGEILTSAYSADLADSIKHVNDQIRITEKELSLRPKETWDPFGERKSFEDELARLKSIKTALRKESLDSAMAIANAQYKKNEKLLISPKIDLSAASKTTKPTKLADPLASLLGSTDIGKIKEFEKNVALLNQRFNFGAKDTALYSQAMTHLVETTFSNNFKLAADDAEFFRMVEEDGIRTTNEWNQRLRELANVDIGRLNDMLANTDFAKLKQDQEDMVLLAKAFSEGIKDADGNLRKLSEAEYLDAVSNRLGLAAEKIDEMDTFAKKAAENIQDSFADFLFDPFDKGLDGMLKGFGETIKRMIADAVAADLTEYLFGDLIKGGSGSGIAGSLLSTIGSFFPSANGNVFANGAGLSAYSGSIVSRPTVFPFANGIGLMGEAGPEAVLPLKRGANGKLGVEGGGGHTINVYVSGNSAPDVRRAAGQGAREGLAMIEGARRYG